MSPEFFMSLFTSPTLNPNHRGGSGTAKKRAGAALPLSSGYVPRLTKAPRRPELIARAARRAAKAA